MASPRSSGLHSNLSSGTGGSTYPEAFTVPDYNVYKKAEAPSTGRPRWVAFFWPSWFLDHLDYQSLKIVLPTFLLVWTTVFIGVVDNSARWLGGSSFLFQVLGFIAAPGGMLVILNVVLAIACILYACFAWLVVTVTMAITARIRGWPTTSQIAEMLISEGTCSRENVSRCMMDQIYTGRFLETRCTVVNVIALIVGIATMGLTDRIHPLARQPYVAGAIFLIINICNGVQIPMFAPTIVGLTVFKPMVLAFVVKMVATCLIFPFTSGWKYFNGGIAVLDAAAAILERNEQFVLTMKPSLESFDNYKQLREDVQSTRLKITALDMFVSSSRLELSYGRLDSGDAADFRAKIKPLLTSISGLEYFYALFQDRKDVATFHFARSLRRETISGKNQAHGFIASRQRKYEKVGEFENNQRVKLLESRFKDEGNARLCVEDLDVIAERINTNNAAFLLATTLALRVLLTWLSAANEFRMYSIFSRKSSVQQQKRCHELLKLEMSKFETACLELDNAEQKVRAKELGDDEKSLALVSQTVLFLFLSRQIGNRILAIFRMFLSIDERRPQPVLSGYFSATNYNKVPTVNKRIFDDDPSEVAASSLAAGVRKRNPDSLDPETPVQLFMYYFEKCYFACLDKHFLFWIKVGILVNVCALPYYCRTSSGWVYNRRAIWFPVVCGLSTAEFTAETVYTYASKSVYSLFGMITGLAAWYISTGSGNGNPYGYVVVTAVVYFVATFYRQFAVHLSKIPAIMVSVTPALVLGTSWVDIKYNHLANIGLGWRVAVTRYICVVAGLTVALLGSTFPTPNSSKVVVRKSLANALEQAASLHCRISEFALCRFDTPTLHIAPRHDKTNDEIRTVLLALANVRALMKPIQYEIALTGRWPTEKYVRLHALATDIVQLYFLIYQLLDQVKDPPQWMPLIVARAGWSHPNLVADMVSLVYMSAESLRLKAELPHTTNANTAFRHLDWAREQWGEAKISLNERIYWRIEGGELRHRNRLNFEEMLSADGQLDVVCYLLMHMVYERVDEAVLVVKGLVGERYEFNERLLEMGWKPPRK